MIINSAGLSDTGRKRKLNEDTVSYDEDIGLWVVADGMGGHAHGEVASKFATDELTEAVKEFMEENPNGSDMPPDILSSWMTGLVNNISSGINRLNKSRGYEQGQGMGTTIAGLMNVGDGDTCVLFNVGDSRIYRLRDGKLDQMSIDHTAYQSWIDDGSIGNPPNKNIITQALGPWPGTRPYVEIDSPRIGDRYLICSDGLTNMLDDLSISDILGSSINVRDICQTLIDKSNENGGKDNISVVIVNYLEDDDSTRTL